MEILIEYFDAAFGVKDFDFKTFNIRFIFLSLFKKVSFLFFLTQLIFIPRGVNRRSALSALKLSLYSALEVNIRYGSATPFVIKSSIITPIYDWDLSKIKISFFCTFKAAFKPAIKPCAAASSYPVVPLIWPARKSESIFFVSKVDFKKIRSIWADVPQYEHYIDKQVEIEAHYNGYLIRQRNDVDSFKKDEKIIIPSDIDYNSFSGLSNEIKSKLSTVRPRTLGQAIRIDGVTPAAVIILLSHIKKSKYKKIA